jgi:RimJ/RimL family protein N-acetyltransferase
MIIEGSQFTLRAYREGDEPSLVKHANNRNVWRNLADLFPHPYTIEAAKEWVQRNVNEPIPHATLAIAINDEVVGGIGLMAKDDVYARTAEVGYWLSEAHWGRGIATEAVGLIVRYAFDELNLARLEAGVFAWNPASARVLEKNGFTLEARLKNRIYKNGTFTDELLYSRLP